MTERIESYLRALKRQLCLRGVFDPESLAEVESHLLEAVEAGIRRGLREEESERQALERFGSVKVVSLAFEKERKNLMQNLLLVFAVLAGSIGNLENISPGIITITITFTKHNRRMVRPPVCLKISRLSDISSPEYLMTSQNLLNCACKFYILDR